MLVVAALRWVDPRPTVDPLTAAVHPDPLASGAGPADRCALEYALRIAEATAGRCVALTVGPPPAEAMLREALAAGADEALRVAPAAQHEAAAGDEAATAGAIADAVRDRLRGADLVLCGDRSLDRGTGATPAFLADRLGAAQALGLVELSLDGARLRALRRLDGGRRERLVIDPPAVCSVEPATAARLRRAPLPAVLAARRAKIPVHTPPDPVRPRIRVGAVRPYRPRPRPCPTPEGTAHARMLALTGALIDRTPPRMVAPPDPASAADELLAFLGEHGYLPGEWP